MNFTTCYAPCEKGCKLEATVTANAHSGIAVEQHEGAAKRGAITNEVTPEQKQSHNESVFLLLFWFLFVFLFVFLFWFWFLYATSEQRNGSITTGCLMILEKTGEAQI